MFEEQMRAMANTMRDQLSAHEEKRREIAELVVEGRSANDLIAVQMGAGGVIKDVTVDPRAMRLDSYTMRDSILEAVDQAHADLKEKTRELLVESIDVESLVGRVELPAELRGILDRFDKQAADFGDYFSKLRRDFDGFSGGS